MKKLIAILLMSVICLTLVACGGGKAEEKALVGEWKRMPTDLLDEFSIIFNEDGTGLYGEDECHWEYDSEKECYALTYMIEQFFTIETENDLRYIDTMAGKFYHIDDYEKAVAANQ